MFRLPAQSNWVAWPELAVAPFELNFEVEEEIKSSGLPVS